MEYDVITLGETMIRLTPPNLNRIEQTTSFDIHVGGSESNVAVGLARLGLRTTWLSRLTANPLGRMIANTLQGFGVDTSHVVWTSEDRVGVYFLEEGRPPRSSRIIYDRANSAISRMQPEALPAIPFQNNPSLVHLTGITLALSDSAAATVVRAAELAKDAGAVLSFDINYRGRLWSPAVARAGCHPLADMADIIFTPLRDAYLLYDLDSSLTPAAVIDALQRLYPQAAIVLTMGSDGAIARQPGHEIYTEPVIDAEPVGRIGGGDAFVAGFLFGYLRYGFPQALRWGTAAASLKYSIPGDIPLFEYDEVAALVQGDTSAGVRR